jgi:hypothetical protein
MLGSAVATSSANLAQDAKIKIAFLGGSHSHAKDKVKVVQESPLYELVGLFEEDPQLREYYQRSGVALAMLPVAAAPSRRMCTQGSSLCA